VSTRLSPVARATPALLRVALAVAGLALLGGLAAPPARAVQTADFPPGYEGYHSYAEMMADIDALIAARPKIVSKRSIGKSYEGRTIWAIKISDHVALDEHEPEILFEALHHAREHLAGEEALHLVHLFVDNYRGRGGTAFQKRISKIVKTHEIWIVPMVNPDGAEYDISSGTDFQHWRRNRQPIPDSSTIGVDLNRNWGYKWGCCGGSSGTPGSTFYRGPSPWFAPEVRALRDFVLSRIVRHHQQIRAAISWHTFNEQIMWPFGYTYADLPPTMAADDLAAFRALGTGMASLNGYTPQQMSDLYKLDGDTTDWLYGDQRIFAFTIEMYPTDNSHVGGFYPPDSVIEEQTTRNDAAVLYFLEHADCPYDLAGLGATRCGKMDDDFETDRGWKMDPFGTDTATAGSFERGVAQATGDAGGSKQPANGYSAQTTLVTGAAAGANANAYDIDGGTTSARSTKVKLGSSSSSGWRLDFRYSFAHDDRSGPEDYLRVSVNGVRVFLAPGDASNQNAGWHEVSVSLDAFAGQKVKVLVEARDGGADSLVEAAVDDVRIYRAH
jgi:carboxypeptidase T